MPLLLQYLPVHLFEKVEFKVFDKAVVHVKPALKLKATTASGLASVWAICDVVYCWHHPCLRPHPNHTSPHPSSPSTPAPGPWPLAPGPWPPPPRPALSLI